MLRKLKHKTHKIEHMKNDAVTEASRSANFLNLVGN